MCDYGGVKLRLLWPLQLLPNVCTYQYVLLLNPWNELSVLTTKFDAQNPLKLAEDLGIWYSLSRLVVLDDRRFLVRLLGQVFLSQLLLHACGLDSLYAV
jgi:hypothetical protein